MKPDRLHSARMAALSGRVDDRSAWKAVLDLYHEDKVVEALDLAKRTGAGEAGHYLRLYRLIEAEAISRPGSDVHRLAPWLEVEYIPEEAPGGIETLVPALLSACDRVSAALGFAHGPPTRIAFLSEAARAPWATSPHGYCMDMYPYEKLCMPSRLLSDTNRLSVVVAHEYAHVATLNLTLGRATHWLEEAVSMQFEPKRRGRPGVEFVSEEEPWLPPAELIAAFGSDDEVDVWEAYEQSMWIGRFLRKLGGDESLGSLLKLMGQDRLISGLWARLLGRTAEDHAMRTVYGFGWQRAFDEAFDWLCDGAPGDPGPL